MTRELTPLYEADDVLPLAVGHHQLVPLVLLQAQTLQRVVLDKVHPDNWHIKSNRLVGLYIHFYLNHLVPFIMMVAHF